MIQTLVFKTRTPLFYCTFLEDNFIKMLMYRIQNLNKYFLSFGIFILRIIVVKNAYTKTKIDVISDLLNLI